MALEQEAPEVRQQAALVMLHFLEVMVARDPEALVVVAVVLVDIPLLVVWQEVQTARQEQLVQAEGEVVDLVVLQVHPL